MTAFAISVGTTIAVTAASGLFGIISTRALGPSQRGLLAAAVVWTSVLSSVLVVGLPQAVTYHAGRAGSNAGRFVATALVLAAVCGLVVALPGVPAALLFGDAVGVPMAILLGAAPAAMVAGCGIAALLGIRSYRTWSMLRFVGPGSALLALIAVVVTGGRTAVAVAVVTSGSWVIQAVAVVAVLRGRQLLDRFDADAARDLVAYGWRQLVAGAAWLMTYKLDQLALSVTATPYSLGLYAAGATVGEVIVPVAASAGAIMLARVAAGGHTEARASVGEAIAFCALVAGGIAVVAFVAAPHLLSLLFGDQFVPAKTVLRILLPGSVALALATVLGDTLRGLGRPLDPAKAEAVGAVCTIVLLAALLPPFGIRGAAIASTASYTLVMVLLAILLQSRLREARDDGA